MEEEGATCASEANPPSTEPQVTDIAPADDSNATAKLESEEQISSDNISSIKDEKENAHEDTNNTDDSRAVPDALVDSPSLPIACKEPFVENDACEVFDDARSLGDLDSLPAGDELVLGAAGSDSGVEGCGRALSSGGGSRSCASSVVSCGSGCGSESSSVAGAPPRPRRRVNVNVSETKRCSPVGSSTPRPVTAPRGPNLATRERARSREKPIPPEKPRPLTPKPRIRPTADLPNLIRESPALRAKPTKTSAARCRTPNSPSEEKRWPANGPRLTPTSDANATRVAADKYGTLPRRRREADAESSPKHESTPPSSRRPTVSRSSSSRSTIKTRVRIYAEKTSQTVLLGTDVEEAFAGNVPNVERVEVSKCSRGVQASARDTDLARLTQELAAARAAAEEERALRLHADAQLQAERAARLAAIAELDCNTKRLLELAGAGAGAGAEGCLRTLEEQLRSAGELAARQRNEIDSLRDHCNKLHTEACSARESARVAEARLAEAEREAAEMHEFLAAETGALSDSLHDAEAELATLNADLDKRRAECRQLVRMCEQRRQEALGWAARARAGAAAAHALDALARRLRRLTRAVALAYDLPLTHNHAYSRSDSGEALSPEEEARGGLLAVLSRALRSAVSQTNVSAVATAGAEDERSRMSDDNDNSAELLDSETEPCLVTDPEYAEEWWSGAEGAGAWSGDELSPEKDSAADIDKEVESRSVSERESLRTLSAAIALRQRSEAEDGERGGLVARALALDARLTELVLTLRAAAAACATSARGHDADAARLLTALRERIDVTEKNIADVVVKKFAELDASKNMMEQYRHSVEMLKNQAIQGIEDDEIEFLEEETSERRARCSALDVALGALGVVEGEPCLDRLAFALPASPTDPPHSPLAGHALPSTA